MIIDDTDHLSAVVAARTPTLTRLSDEQGMCRFFNEAWVKFVGRSADDQQGNGWLKAVHTEDRQAVIAAYREATAAHADVEINYRLQRRDGSYRWVLERASPWRDQDGNFGGLVSAALDVTQLKTPRAVNTTDRRAMRLPSVVLRLGAGRILSASASLQALFGVTAEDVVGKTPGDSTLPGAVITVIDELLATARDTTSRDMDEGGARDAELEFSLRTGDQEQHLAACLLAEGENDFLVMIHDVTACVEATTLHRESLQREEISRQRADAAARSRDQFLSVVSHELRSPLNGIQSWAHVLESQIDTSRPIVQRALAGIKTGVTQQVSLIEALLDATQILNGHLTLMQQPYSLNGVVQTAIDGLRNEAAQKEIEVAFVPQFSDIDMIGDAERIQQIVRHLLSNAIKFTDDGGFISISVTREKESAVISVEDNGSGIPPGMAASLFEPFRQADSSQTRRATGLGLGLAVSRRIAELHGGGLQCESEGTGHGSTFRLVLPLPR